MELIGGVSHPLPCKSNFLGNFVYIYGFSVRTPSRN